MKKILCFLLLILVLTNTVGFAAHVYPEYTGANENSSQVTERINIVFDNSGHEDVKSMVHAMFRLASIAENASVWIYPIAGSNEIIKIETTKEFVEANFNKYTKSSNEFKAENMMQKAIDDLVNDTSVSSKRLIMYADTTVVDIRPEYSIYGVNPKYSDMYPDIKFTSFYSDGRVYQPTWSSDYRPNYEFISGEGIISFFLIKNGYSKCESIYNREQGYIKLEKGKVDYNIVVMADDDIAYLAGEYAGKNISCYLSGAAMNTKTFEDYKKKSKVKGVALSYNHLVTDAKETNTTSVTALYTLDGETVNPASDDVYIPLINAENVSVYHKETKGAGVCSKETVYNAEQDRKVTNKYYVEPEPEVETVKNSESKEIFSLIRQSADSNKSDESIFSKILSVVLKVLRFILALILSLIRLLLLAFIIGLIASKKFRAYIQLKILATKFGPYYEKYSTKIRQIIKDIIDSGKKIKGDADLNKKFVFISKASADMATPNNRIELVIAELEKRGISCWLSEKGIKPGQNYNIVLPEAIRKCSLFLLFVSTMSVKSSEVISEISTAKEYKKNIIPVQIEPFNLFGEFTDWSYMLKPYQKTDLFNSKPDEIKQLADYIEQMFNNL